ncbi:MAG: hypothetical protein AAB846_00155 [Patescibacteria group bacterium]
MEQKKEKPQSTAGLSCPLVLWGVGIVIAAIDFIWGVVAIAAIARANARPRE